MIDDRPEWSCARSPMLYEDIPGRNRFLGHPLERWVYHIWVSWKITTGHGVLTCDVDAIKGNNRHCESF